MIDIAAIKARADKATGARFSLAGTYFDHASESKKISAEISEAVIAKRTR